jgi:hypothetical protein
VIYELMLFIIALTRGSLRPSRLELAPPTVSYPRPRLGYAVLGAEGAEGAVLYRSSMATILLPATAAPGQGDEAAGEVALLGTPRVLLSKELEQVLAGAGEKEGGGGE